MDPDRTLRMIPLSTTTTTRPSNQYYLVHVEDYRYMLKGIMHIARDIGGANSRAIAGCKNGKCVKTRDVAVQATPIEEGPKRPTAATTQKQQPMMTTRMTRRWVRVP